MSELETRIEQVVVYPDRALVKREGEIELSTGRYQIEVNGLPLSMNPDSVRALARAEGEVGSQLKARLLGVQVQRVFFQQAPAEQVKELEDLVNAVQDELGRLDRRMELVKVSRQQVEALAGQSEVFATALASGEMSVETQMGLFASLQVRIGELDSELQKTEGERREIERRLAQLKKQLEQVSSSRPPERYRAIIEVEALESAGLFFELSYVVSNSGWKPLYDLRLDEKEGKRELELGYLAQVTQQSGEDWEGVDLLLSTARPALSATLPELKPWFVQPLPTAPPSPPVRPAGVRMASREAPKELIMETATLQPVEEVLAEVDASGAVVVYHIPQVADIPSDGSPHKVVVARLRLEPELDYVTAPKLVEAAYRRAKVLNDSDYLLLPGAVNLFAGEEFLGRTSLELTPPRGEIELYLGVDDRIKVERELMRREVDKSLVGGKRRVHYGYVLRMENLNPTMTRLVVHDQIPVARHEEIKVKLDIADPKPKESSELNLLDWELNLATGEKKSIRFEFTVEYPQEMQVMGLP